MCKLISQASKSGKFNKNVGNHLYNLATKLSKQFHDYLPLMINYIVQQKINQDAKLTAAIKFIQVSLKFAN